MKKILALIVFSLFLITPSVLHAEDFKITEVKLSNFGIGAQQGGPPSGQSSGPSQNPYGGSPGAQPSGSYGASPGGQPNGSGNSVYYSINFTTNLAAENGDLLIKSKENADQKLEIFGFTRLSEVGSKEKAQKISDAEFSFPNAGHPLFTDIFYGDWIIVEATSTSGQKVFSDVYLITPDGKLEKVAVVPANTDPTSKQTNTSSASPTSTQNPATGKAEPSGQSGQPGEIGAASFNNFCSNLSGDNFSTKISRWACQLFQSGKGVIDSWGSPYAKTWDGKFYVINIISMFFLNYIIFVGLTLYALWIVTKIKPYGIVFDSQTKAPIQGAIVRIFDAEKNKLLETKVTDQAGNYNFIVKPGLYYIGIIKPQFSFPTKEITKAEIPQYYRIYKGELIRVTRNTNLSINIPLDPQSSKETEQNHNSGFKKFLSFVVFYLIKARWLLIFIAIPAGIFLYFIQINGWYIYLFGGGFALILEIAWYLAGRKIQLKEKTK
ncbi:MAG: hypothetical protein M1338_04420 [Patescibacteria group bacterium]|nr:hypothetical protein [Patescibacteria group bacterium]